MSLLLTTCFCLLAAGPAQKKQVQSQETQTQQPMPSDKTQQPMPSDNTQQSQPSKNGGACAQLTTDEQEFSTQLTQSNKTLFCTQFTPAQRARAMDIAGQMGLDGNLITNDQAVEKVAKEANIQVPTSSTAPRRQGSSCPAIPKK